MGIAIANLPKSPELCLPIFEVNSTKDDHVDAVKKVIDVLFSEDDTHLKSESLKLVTLLHRYARENLLLANIYIKDPAVTLIKRDQKVPVIWFVANVGGILGLCMGCSLVTLFEVLHHVLLMFLKTGKRSVSRIQRTMGLGVSPTPSDLVLSSPNQRRKTLTVDTFTTVEGWNPLHVSRTQRTPASVFARTNRAISPSMCTSVPPSLAKCAPRVHRGL